MHRSPSDRSGSRLSAGNSGSRCRAAGWRAGQAEPVLAGHPEQCRPETEGDGQSGRRQTDRLAGVVRRRSVGSGGGAVLTRPEAGGHPGRRRRPVLQQFDQLGTRVGDQIERGEVQPILGRCDDAGLMGTVERVAARARRHGDPGRLGLIEGEPARDPRGQPDHAGARRAEHATPGNSRCPLSLARCTLSLSKGAGLAFDRLRPHSRCALSLSKGLSLAFDRLRPHSAHGIHPRPTRPRRPAWPTARTGRSPRPRAP